MICTCRSCRYTFKAPTIPSRCPDCGKKWVHLYDQLTPAIRPATNDEIQWYREIQEELARESQSPGKAV